MDSRAELRPGGAVTVLAGLPSISHAYAAAVVQARHRRRVVSPGLLDGGALRVVNHRCAVDRLAAYGRVCHFGLTGDLPPTFLHVLTFPLQLQLMTDPAFPLTALGMVHVSNEMWRLRPVEVGEPLTLTSWAADLRPHAKGVSVDLIGQAHAGTELVWQGRSHYLARGARWRGDPAAAESGEPATAGTPPAAGNLPTVGEVPLGRWRLPADLGRRYARVSGDVNPIHLSALSARAFGFRRTIAHGMWTHARSLAALGRLPERYLLTARFRRPLPLPSTPEVFGSAARSLPRAIEVRHRDELAVRTVVSAG